MLLVRLDIDMNLKDKIRFYFKNLFNALLGRTGFYLRNSKPDTWYKITEMNKVNEHPCYGYILTNNKSCFIPFIQHGDNFTWSKIQLDNAHSFSEPLGIKTKGFKVVK